MGSAIIGSSPRGRGKRHLEVGLQHLPGLIPARAGKTPPGGRLPRARRAHPRAGGENLGQVRGCQAHQGSSPRGRGKPLSTPRVVSSPGLIPARAGKTCCTRTRSAHRPAHPRAGGENGCGRRPRVSVKGSSPRGRGKHPLGVAFRAHDGLIPARAGKTTATTLTALRPRAHPRAGGENTF